MSQGRGGPFLENILSDQTSEMAFRNEILAASFRQLGYNALPSAFEYDDNAETTEKNLINSLILCYKIIMCMDNLTLTSTTDQYLEMGINPGCAVLWIKPQFVESDAMIISQPAGYNYINANPVLVKELDVKDSEDTVNFTWKQHSARCPNATW